MNLGYKFNLVMGIGWITAAALDLLLQRPVSWYVSMLMCIGLAMWHIHASIITWGSDSK